MLQSRINFLSHNRRHFHFPGLEKCCKIHSILWTEFENCTFGLRKHSVSFGLRKHSVS